MRAVHAHEALREWLRADDAYHHVMGKDTPHEKMKKSGGMGAARPKQYLNANKYKCLDW